MKASQNLEYKLVGLCTSPKKDGDILFLDWKKITGGSKMCGPYETAPSQFKIKRRELLAKKDYGQPAQASIQ